MSQITTDRLWGAVGTLGVLAVRALGRSAVRSAPEREPAAIVGHTREVDRIVVEAAGLEPETLAAVLGWCRRTSVPVSLLPPSPDAAALGRAPLLVLHVAPPSKSARALKRMLDVVGSAVALALLAPVMLAVALAVRADSRGPAFFPQRRVGRGGRVFVMWKFRTMVANAEDLRAELIARSRDPHWLHVDMDPRITRVGRFLRHTSLDELPQLWNVLRGDMSLVGPRPLIPEEHERIPASARRRSDVAPGITGLWQVMGRTRISFEGMLRLDQVYVATWSLSSDLEILLRTVPAVLSARGAN